MKKKVISILIGVLIILQVLFPIFTYANQNEVTQINENIEKNFKSNINLKQESTNYSEAYLEYLALPEEEKAKLSVIPRKYNVPLDSIYENTIVMEEEPSLFNLFGLFAEKTIVSAEEEEIPATFNLRDEIEIKPKNQGGFGLCWAFASMRSLETNLLLQKQEDKDFSEMHVGYISNIIQRDDTFKGGLFDYFKDYVKGNYGPILEEEVSYENAGDPRAYDITKDDDKNKLLNDFETQVYNVQIFDFPTMGKKSPNYTEEDLELFREKVKKHIMENGSIYATIYSKEIKKINEKNTLYNTNQIPDHAISIIGWDDTFSRTNFKNKDSKMPEKDGAYIALNSWGSEETEDDIIYISYEDVTVESDMSGVVSASTNLEEAKSTIKFNDVNLYEVLKKDLEKNVVGYDDTLLELYVLNKDREITLDLNKTTTR